MRRSSSVLASTRAEGAGRQARECEISPYGMTRLTVLRCHVMSPGWVVSLVVCLRRRLPANSSPARAVPRDRSGIAGSGKASDNTCQSLAQIADGQPNLQSVVPPISNSLL